jgi:hypothetical protein
MRATLGLLALLAACRPASPDPIPPPVPSAPVTVESPRVKDLRWVRARGDDPLDKERLAVAVGAAELVAGVDDRDDVAQAALASLPFADDAEVALGTLADRLTSARSPPGWPRTWRASVLTAILGVAGQPRRQREPLDPEGARRCGEALLAFAADTGKPRDERALAISAVRALAERGYVDRGRIPSDLDTKSR